MAAILFAMVGVLLLVSAAEAQPVDVINEQAGISKFAGLSPEETASRERIEREYLAKARANIEQFRKGDVAITVTDGLGRPVQGAQIEVNQVTQEFLFGNQIWEMAGMWPKDQAKLDVLKQRFKALYNFAIVPFYWSAYEKKPGFPEWQGNEAMIKWLRENGFTLKGHPLAWNYFEPRWLPDDLGSFYVAVNVPEFILRVMAEGGPTFTTRVVVGAPDTQTPIFSQDLQEIVFRPYWRVPNSMKTEELLPYIHRRKGDSLFSRGSWDIGVLKSYSLRVSIGGREVDPSRLDWGHIDIRDLDIYQPPGPDNVLGNVKFVFPNKHDVYMHDTPSRGLFRKVRRDFSHGCIRLEDPGRLAEWVLRDTPGWTRERIDAAMKGDRPTQVNLKEKLTVFLFYDTAYVDSKGVVNFADDYYGHDARLENALRHGYPYPRKS